MQKLSIFVQAFGYFSKKNHQIDTVMGQFWPHFYQSIPDRRKQNRIAGLG